MIGRPAARRCLTALGIGIALGSVAPSDVLAQVNRECSISQADLVRRFQSGTAVNFWGEKVDIRCTDGSVIQADTMSGSQFNGTWDFFSDVLFRDPENELRADRATYREGLGQLVAWGNVRLVDRTTGSVTLGDTVVLYQANEVRPQNEFRVRGRRPRATLYSEAGAENPFEVDADDLFFRGDSRFEAYGTVEVRREGLEAFSDSLRFDQEGETVALSGAARVEDDAFDIFGDRIYLRVPGDVLDELISVGDARVDGDSIEVVGDSIRIRLEERRAREIVAQYAARLLSDSLTANAHRLHLFMTPEGEIERLVELSESWFAREVAPPADSLADLLADSERLDANVEAPRTPPVTAPPDAFDPTLDDVESEDPAESEEEIEADPRSTLMSEQVFLAGDSIDLIVISGALDRVTAIGRAHGEALTFAEDSAPDATDSTADTLTLEIEPPSAVSDTIVDTMAAPDSTGLPAPATEVLEDTLPSRPPLPDFLRKDWIEADTIVAYFGALPPPGIPEPIPPEVASEEDTLDAVLAVDDSVAGAAVDPDSSAVLPDTVTVPDTTSVADTTAVADTVTGPEPISDLLSEEDEFDERTESGPPDGSGVLKRLDGIGNARAVYRMRESTEGENPGAECDFAINYVRGRHIVVYFNEGAVRDIEVAEAIGTYLSPVCGSPPSNSEPDGTGRINDESSGPASEVKESSK